MSKKITILEFLEKYYPGREISQEIINISTGFVSSYILDRRSKYLTWKDSKGILRGASHVVVESGEDWDETLFYYFLEFNEKYFNNELQLPAALQFTDMKKVGGEYYSGKLPRIFINERLKVYGEKEIRDTLLHEMCHYFVDVKFGYKECLDKSPLFRKKLQEVGGTQYCSPIPPKKQIKYKLFPIMSNE